MSVGGVKHRISGSKVPSNGQVFELMFYDIRKLNLSVNESAYLLIRESIMLTKWLPHTEFGKICEKMQTKHKTCLSSVDK